MAERHFTRMSLDFCHEIFGEEDENTERGTEESLHRLLLTSYPFVAKKLKNAALKLKEKIVAETWGELTNTQKVDDFSLYSGALGTAFLLFKSFQVTDNADDLKLCSEIVKACDSASLHSKGRDLELTVKEGTFVNAVHEFSAYMMHDVREVTFICGRAGVCALGAVAAKCMGDDQLMNSYLTKFQEIELPKDLPDELLHGRAGYLWACLFINRHLGKATISPTLTGPVVQEIISNGRKLGGNGGSPLMFDCNGKKYWGAAHGLAGILHTLMHFELKPDVREDVKGSLLYMINNRFPSGNYRQYEEDQSDVLVHWCHGAPGVALTLVKAAEVFRDKKFVQAAADAAMKVVWERGLLKRVGICHGISGNAHVFRALYRLTGNTEFRFKAKSFTCFLLDRGQKLISNGEMHGGDHPYSLFQGIGGSSIPGHGSTCHC